MISLSNPSATALVINRMSVSPTMKKKIWSERAPLSHFPFYLEISTWAPVKINRRGSIVKKKFDPSNEFITNPHLAHSKK